MKINLYQYPKAGSNRGFTGKSVLLLLGFLCFYSILQAGIKPLNKQKNGVRGERQPQSIAPYNAKAGNKLFISAKTVTAATSGMSYASPQVYKAGTAISPLTPTGGTAAAPGYSTGTTTLGSGFNNPGGIAVDSKGNVFVADQNNIAVKEIPGGTGAPVTIGSGFSTPVGVAVDALGNVYVADDGSSLIKEIPLLSGTYGTPVVLGAAFTFRNPFGVAVDTKGNVYVADYGNNVVEEIPIGGGTVSAIGSGFAAPSGVAVDLYGKCICS